MPQAQNLTVKDAAGNPKTFELITPAAGDGGVAEWAIREGSISAVFPRLTASATKSANNGRNLKIRFLMPSSYQDTVTGRTNVASAAAFHGSVAVPNDFPEIRKDDFVALATGIFQQALIRAMVRDALPAN